MKIDKTCFNQERFTVYFLLFLIYLITFYPLTKIGFTVGDDIDFYIELGKDNLHEIIRNTAFSHGRFFFLFMRYFLLVPHLIDNPIYFDLCYILPIASSFILFSRLIQRVFNSDSITLFSAILLASSFQIAAFHSSTTAYPFFFTLGFCFLLISFHVFLSFYEKNKKYILILSAILMFIATLFYEAFLMYYLVFLMIAIWKNNLFSIKTKANYIKTIKHLIPFFIGGTVYLITYFTFQQFFPPQYIGASVSENITPWGLLKTATLMSKLAFPVQNFYDYNNLLLYRNTNIDGVFNIFSLDLIVFVQGLIIMVLAYYAMNKYKTIKYIHLLWGFILGICLVYIPLTIISFSSRYYLQNWHSYVPTFFSFFGYTLSILMILFALLNLLSFSKIIRQVFQILACLGLFWVSIITQTTNRAIAQDLELSEFRFEMVDFAFEKEVIPNLTAHTPICFEQANLTTSSLGKWVIGQYFNWKDFLIKQVGKEYNIMDSYVEFVQKNKTEERVWVCFSKQATKSSDAIMYFAGLNGEALSENQNEILCDTIIVLYRSTFKEFNLIIATQNPDDTIYINNQPINSIGNFKTINLSLSFIKGHNSSVFQITGKNIIASSLSISNILNYGETLTMFSLTSLSFEDRVNITIEKIKSNASWFELIKTKAKQTNKPLEEVLKNDAIWYLGNGGE